ncbi:hypothetical protein [Devosia sp.]
MTNIEGVSQTIADRLDKAPSPGLRFAKTDLSPEGRRDAVPGNGITGKQA